MIQFGGIVLLNKCGAQQVVVEEEDEGKFHQLSLLHACCKI